MGGWGGAAPPKISLVGSLRKTQPGLPTQRTGPPRPGICKPSRRPQAAPSPSCRPSGPRSLPASCLESHDPSGRERVASEPTLRSSEGNSKASGSPRDKSNSGSPAGSREHVWGRFVFDLWLHAPRPRQCQVSPAFPPQPMESRQRGSEDRLALISNRGSDTS